MIRLLVMVGGFYLLYKLLKEAVLPSGPRNVGGGRNGADAIDDVMVKDPQCEVYFPLREGFPAQVGGKTVHFCSKECRDKYLESH